MTGYLSVDGDGWRREYDDPLGERGGETVLVML